MPHLRRFVAISLAAGLLPEGLAAQTCFGHGSYDVGRYQLMADAVRGNSAQGFSATAGVGSFGFFGMLGVGRVTYDNYPGHTTSVGGVLGFQIDATPSGRASICPFGTVSYGFGPEDIDGAGTNVLMQTVTGGLSLGAEVVRRERFSLVPAAGLGFAYSRTVFRTTDGDVQDSSPYGIADFGLGFVIDRRVAIRPFVSRPFGLEDAEASVGVSVSMIFRRERY